MTWLIEWKVFSSIKGVTERQIRIDAPSKLEALEANWPGKDFEFDEDDDRYFSVITLPGGPMIAGRITAKEAS